MWKPQWEFGPDWPTHLYPIGYQGYYFRQHHWFTETLNTDWVVGMPYPVFYAFIFYPMAALLAAVVGADWAVRLIAIGLLATQTWQVRKLLRSAGGNEGLSCLGAATLAWAAYALTNLYTRGAIAEFVAVSLLISATASFLRSAFPGEGSSQPRLAFQGAFFYALSAGSHPITALFGTLFLACVLPTVFFAAWRRLQVAVLVGSVVAVMILAPWLYALGKFGGTLTVARESTKEVVHFPNTIDSIQMRLWPWPRDVRMGGTASLEKVSSGYLDAQISVPLMLLAAAVSLWVLTHRTQGNTTYKNGLRLMGISWGIFALAFVLSVWPAPWQSLPQVLRSIQFAYRLVSYQNLALLTALTGALLMMSSESWKARARCGWAMFGLWLLAAAGITVMLSHVFEVQRSPSRQVARVQSDSDAYVNIPYSFYGWPAYSILGETAETNQPARRVRLRVEVGDRFGQVAPTRFELDATTNVCLQVQPFPWNRIYLDGEPLDKSRVHTRPEGYTLQISAGTHGVEFLWQPDPTWAWLDLLSKFATLVGGIGTLGLSIREQFTRKGYLAALGATPLEKDSELDL
ncbi:MAG TPA: hypothetical protein VMZ27_17350 [Candidatus Saccharimonadales bacterium]|nr:hypothetical protein [Candidatus Saccharimonadales bacterium]